MSNTIQEFLQQATVRLMPQVDNPRLEAELLLAYTLAKPRTSLHAWPETILTAQQLLQAQACLERRLTREPLAYITGKKEFWSLELNVNAYTLIPRPETELLISAVLARFTQPIKLADLGTGSGAIALALAKERPEWEIVATDVSKEALQVAQSNARALALQNISFQQGDWCAALAIRDFHVLVSNPPYIAETEWANYASGLQYEPRTALVSGIDGLDAVRDILAQGCAYLRSGGYLFLEHGFAQAPVVRELFTQFGYQEVETLIDLAGLERVTLGVRKK